MSIFVTQFSGTRHIMNFKFNHLSDHPSTLIGTFLHWDIILLDIYGENKLLEVCKIGTKEKYTDTFTNILVSNKFPQFYRVCMINEK